MITIEKIKLHNFKRFKDLEIDLNPDINIFIGDNESGKSTILQAINIVAHGSRTRVENIGLDKLFNIDVMNEFMNGNRNYINIPEMYVELYFSDQTNPELEGSNNSRNIMCSGIRLLCRPNDTYSKQITDLMNNRDAAFPLEFYNIIFETFAGELFNGYSKMLNCIFIDNSTIGNPHAMREYVKDIYHAQLTDEQRINARYGYKKNKIQFQKNKLSQYNALISPYSFAIRDSSDDNIETDITLVENDIPLEIKGTGIQCFIKTKLSLNKSVNNIHAVLIEEPENHLSYAKMLELIELIKGSQDRQLFISTHCNLIATRLNLRKCLLFNSLAKKVISLDNLPDETADFFIKAPDNNMLQFVLSQKSILVEGDAEFILMESLYKRTVNKELSSSGIGIIAVDGKCFKRYLEIAKLLKNKVAVITDNDHDYDSNIKNNYSEYTNNKYNNIQIFSDKDNNRYTFEVCIYEDNKSTCNSLFQTKNRTLETLDYMLKNKANAAYKLLKEANNTLIVPQYIDDAIKWIDA